MSIHVCECVHNGRDEYHLRYPGMSKAAAQEIADKINGGALSRKQAQPEPHSDDIAVDAMAAAMKEKLAQAREKGRGGWETCSQQDLSRMLREHVDKGDPRDVANFCAFLYALGFWIAQPEPDLRHRIRVHLSNRYYYSHKEFCEKLEEIVAGTTSAQPEPVEPADTRVHLAGPNTPVYYVLHADGTYSEANPQPAQPKQVSITDEQILALNTGEVFFSESPSKYPECGHGTQYHAGAPGVVGFARAILAAAKRGDV